MKSHIILIITILLCSSFILAESDDEGNGGIKPDSIFWGLDRAFEKISLALKFNDHSKALKALEIARERRLEAQAMAEEGKSEHSNKAMLKWQENIERAKKEKEELENDGKIEEAEEVDKGIENAIAVLQEIVGRFENDDNLNNDEALKGLNSALENLGRNLDRQKERNESDDLDKPNEYACSDVPPEEVQSCCKNWVSENNIMVVACAGYFEIKQGRCSYVCSSGDEINNTEEPSVIDYSCEEDSDCVSVSKSCCGCNNGGNVISMNKNYQDSWEENLSIRCSGGVSCAAVMSQHISCFSDPVCVDNICKLIPNTQNVCNSALYLNCKDSSGDALDIVSSLNGISCREVIEMCNKSCYPLFNTSCGPDTVEGGICAGAQYSSECTYKTDKESCESVDVYNASPNNFGESDGIPDCEWK